jgi:hypothetical protein
MPIPPPEMVSMQATIKLDGEDFPLVEIRSTGDVLLDVLFKNTSHCTKSIPKDALRLLRTKKTPLLSPRIIYRVRLETLKKHSEYFQILLKPQFAEGLAVAETFARLAEGNEDPGEIEAERLPRIKIVDEDVATKTFGRENIFRDLLRIVHGMAVSFMFLYMPFLTLTRNPSLHRFPPSA